MNIRPFYAEFIELDDKGREYNTHSCTVFDVNYDENEGIKFLTYCQSLNISGYYPIERFGCYSPQAEAVHLKHLGFDLPYHLEQIESAIKNRNNFPFILLTNAIAWFALVIAILK